MHQKALEIFEAIGNKKGMASTYFRLGYVSQDRGDLDRAEETYQMALEIFESMGNKEGIARAVDNLGNVYSDRYELDID